MNQSRFDTEKRTGTLFQVITVLLAIFTAAVQPVSVEAEGINDCFAREGKMPIVDEESTAQYKRELFLTPDGIARYVFLTNRRDDGDRAAAIYQSPRREGALPGGSWLTATVATDSVRDKHRVGVRRFDAPLPASLAHVLHELWLTLCQQIPINEKALPSAPTGLFSVSASSGARLTVVTVSLINDKSFCFPMLELGESLVDYAKLPPSKRLKAAAEIEKQAHHLLQQLKREESAAREEKQKGEAKGVR